MSNSVWTPSCLLDDFSTKTKWEFNVGSPGQFCGLGLLIFLYKFVLHWHPCFIHHIYHHHPGWLYVQHIVVRLIYKIERYVSELDHTYNILYIRTSIYTFTRSLRSPFCCNLYAGQRALTLALTLLFFSWHDFDTFNYIVKFWMVIFISFLTGRQC